MWAVVGGIVLSIVIQIMAAKHLVRELAGWCRMMSGRMCVGELRICSPEGRVVLYDHMSSLVASSIPSVGIADSTVVGVLDISETGRGDLCAEFSDGGIDSGGKESLMEENMDGGGIVLTGNFCHSTLPACSHKIIITYTSRCVDE